MSIKSLDMYPAIRSRLEPAV